MVDRPGVYQGCIGACRCVTPGSTVLGFWCSVCKGHLRCQESCLDAMTRKQKIIDRLHKRSEEVLGTKREAPGNRPRSGQRTVEWLKERVVARKAQEAATLTTCGDVELVERISKIRDEAIDRIARCIANAVLCESMETLNRWVSEKWRNCAHVEFQPLIDEANRRGLDTKSICEPSLREQTKLEHQYLAEGLTQKCNPPS